MKQNIEIEFKSMLSPFDFNRLRDQMFSDIPYVVQENIYYDSYNRDLFNQRIMVRIRKLDSYSLFTLKQVSPDNQLIEYEVVDEQLSIDDPRIINLLRSLNLPIDLVPISKSLTHRYIKNDKYGQWCLDLNEFENFVDFELEYELFEDVPQGLDLFLDRLNSYSIPYLKSASKYSRSFTNIG